MSRKLIGKNTLPLLAITVLLLSFSLVNYQQSIVSDDGLKQEVLSESDEDRSEDGREDEEDETDEQETNEARNESREESREVKRVETRNATKATEKPRVKLERLEIVEVEDNNEDENEDEDENEVEDSEDQESEFEQESETVAADGTVNRFKLKVKTRTVAGKTVVETASGEMEVENDPDEVINDLVDDGLIDTPTSFEAKENRNKVEYEIQGTDSKRFLGIFDVVIPKVLTVSSETGEVISTGQNVWSRILSLLSI